MVGTQKERHALRLFSYMERYMSRCALILMTLLCVFIFYDALMRSLGHPTIWVFETSTYFFIFIGFLGNALAVKKGAHFRVTFLRQAVPSLAGFLDLLSDISVILFGVLLISSGAYFTWYLVENSILSSTLLETPLWIPSLAVPLGGLALVLQTLVSIVERRDSLQQSPSQKEG